MRFGVWQILTLVVGGVVFLDQASKLVISRLGFGYSLNRGVVFGFLPNTNWVWMVVVVFFGVFLLWSLNRLSKSKSLREAVCLGFILGGGLSNIVDRFIRGGVMDFMRVGVGPWFNFADVFLSLGVFLALLDYYQYWKSNLLGQLMSKIR